MLPPSEYPGVILTCCKHQVTVHTTPTEEVTLQVMKEIKKEIECPKCKKMRMIHIKRNGAVTNLRDVTPASV